MAATKFFEKKDMSDDEIQYISAESCEKFNEELRKLKSETIPAIAKRIDEARQMGDLSENAEYHSARDEMAWAQTRTQELERILSNYSIISKPASTNSASIGSTILVKIKGIEKKYTIVGPHEADPINGHISNESPLGQSFLGKKVGDAVVVTAPAGDQTYMIIDIS